MTEQQPCISIQNIRSEETKMKTHVDEIITFMEVRVQNTPVLWDSDILDIATIPKCFHYYEVSYDEETLEHDILAKKIDKNRIGFVLSLKHLKLDENGQYKINPNKDIRLNSAKGFSSIEEFLEKYA